MTFAGAGVMLTGIGIGLYAHHKYSAEFDNGNCMMPDADQPQCTQAGLAATHSARSLGWVGTGVAVAGVLAVGVGVTLWVTAPHHEAARQVSVVPSVSPDEASVVAIGRF